MPLDGQIVEIRDTVRFRPEPYLPWLCEGVIIDFKQSRVIEEHREVISLRRKL
jgi:hypothetical protein